MSNRLDPDQARHIVGPGLGPNCLQKLADDLNRPHSLMPDPTYTRYLYFMYQEIILNKILFKPKVISR